MANTPAIHVSKMPRFDDIPPVKGASKGCAWELFNIDGQRDQVGTLNLLTPDVVLAAKDEIQEGSSVALNWQMQNCDYTGFGRKTLEHRCVLA